MNRFSNFLSFFSFLFLNRNNIKDIFFLKKKKTCKQSLSIASRSAILGVSPLINQIKTNQNKHLEFVAEWENSRLAIIWGYEKWEFFSPISCFQNIDGKSRGSVNFVLKAIPISTPTNSYIDNWRDEVQEGLSMYFSRFNPTSFLPFGQRINRGSASLIRSWQERVMASL